MSGVDAELYKSALLKVRGLETANRMLAMENTGLKKHVAQLQARREVLVSRTTAVTARAELGKSVNAQRGIHTIEAAFAELTTTLGEAT